MIGPDPRPFAKPAMTLDVVDRWRPAAPVESDTVGSVVPPGLEAYRCVLHPPDQVVDGQPWEGEPPMEVVEPLIELLHGRTATGRWWIGVWEGYASLREGGSLQQLHSRWPLARWRARRSADRWEREHDSYARWVEHAPRFEGWSGRADRRFFLFEGGPEAVFAFAGRREGPNLWWPDDGAWCVVTDIGLAWTYVGASAATIAALDQLTWIDARAVRLDEPLVDHPPPGR